MEVLRTAPGTGFYGRLVRCGLCVADHRVAKLAKCVYESLMIIVSGFRSFLFKAADFFGKPIPILSQHLKLCDELAVLLGSSVLRACLESQHLRNAEAQLFRQRQHQNTRC